MRPTTLSIHRRRSHLPVDPASREDLVSITSVRDADLAEAVDIDSMLDVFSEMEATRRGVEEVKHLFVVDLQEGALTQKLNEVTKLCRGEREEGGGVG